MGDALRAAGVRYWLDFGTLLRAVRDGTIDGDTDIDLGMLYDARACAKAMNALRDRGFRISRGYLGTNLTQFKAHHPGCIPIDFHIWRIKGAKAWTGAGHIPTHIPAKLRGFMQRMVKKWSQYGVTQYGGWPYRRVWWVVPKEHFEFPEDAPLCLSLDHHPTPIPEWHPTYLRVHYGPDWRTPVPDWLWHRDSRCIQRVPP